MGEFDFSVKPVGSGDAKTSRDYNISRDDNRFLKFLNSTPFIGNLLNGAVGYVNSTQESSFGGTNASGVVP